MIIGGIQEERSSDILCGYATVLCPKGILNVSELYVSQGGGIGRIYHIRLQEEGGLTFRSYMEQELRELKLLE